MNFIPVNEPLLEGNEKKYLNECIDTGWISSDGPFVKRFEKEFSSKLGRKYGVAVSNGTAAIDIAVQCLEIGVGDEVIIPSFTIISTILQIVRSGAKPVLIDSDPLTWNMNVDHIEAKITSNTKAILAVHIYGLPVEMEDLINLCRKYNLKLIEDAAEVIGQTYRSISCGSFGDISTVSFYPNKHITTGEGGMVLTDDKTLAEKCRKLRNLYFDDNNRFVHTKLGWNYRMSNLQAAVGVAQLEQLDFFIKKKRYIGKLYNEKLSELKSLQLPLDKTDYATNIYWVYGVILKPEIKLSAKEVMKKLLDNGIGCRPFFYPMHLQPVLKKLNLFDNQHYPVAENLYERGFYIPSGLSLDKKKISSVVDVLFKIVKK
ncbi:DegT/DnrJ/EryC1/StrS family aminotransferase [Candidatus Pelagibacter sp. HIMB1593]|uniref:DegT/DnrJ/EryC1/StrS family aminotransferase n=1 Tax=Candidatus Pelagibacter sp. HIMB1593 TaxID=3413355 RepID=UPI003F835316